jgi:hypothetical protein
MPLLVILAEAEEKRSHTTTNAEKKGDIQEGIARDGDLF